MTRQYDLVIIGTGTAASVAAHRCRAVGWRVAVIDHQPFGGTCALRGCDPKKVLVGVAETLDQDRHRRGKGIAGGELTIDWPRLMAFKRGFTGPVPHQREEDLARRGIDAFHGRAKFRGPREIEVGDDVLQTQRVLIAAGAVPKRLGMAGEEHLIASADFLELEELPRRIVFVGGGYIAAEFSHLAIRVGSMVTVCEQSDRVLSQFDPDLVVLLCAKSAGLGVDLRLKTKVNAIEKTDIGFRVTVDTDGAASTLDADLVVHAAGRVPDLEPLNLEAAGVTQENGRLKLNAFLQSVSNPAVYAAGDAASSGPPLTPVASHDAKIVATNMIEGNRERPNYLGVPSIVFTIPPLARVGLLEEEARAQHRRFRVKHENTSSWYSARRVGEECAGFKVLVEEDTRLILGAHLIGPHAEELINLFGLAIRMGLTADQVQTSIFGYPTAASDIAYMV